MTATVADLLGLLERQAHKLPNVSAKDTARAHVGGWMLLAKSTRRAISMLPLGGTARAKAGLRAVLDPLIYGPRESLSPFTPAAGLIRTARTMGAIADLLAHHTEGGGRPEHLGTEAIKLQTGLMSAVHVIARWSRSVTEGQDFPKTAIGFRSQIADLIVITEPSAMIPPNRRSSLVGDLRLPNPTAPALEGAVTRWVDEATLVLQERYRVTGWAMQTIAGNLSLLSQIGERAVSAASGRGELPADHAQDLAGTLAESARQWRAAATWPTHVRLGGATPQLRLLGDQLRAAYTGPTSDLGDVRNTLDAVLPLARLHESVMEALTYKHELWVHRVRTDHLGQEVETWIREPPWSFEGQPLLRAARDGHHALDNAVRQLIQVTGSRRVEAWPPEQVTVRPSQSTHRDLELVRRNHNRARPILNP